MNVSEGSCWAMTQEAGQSYRSRSRCCIVTSAWLCYCIVTILFMCIAIW